MRKSNKKKKIPIMIYLIFGFLALLTIGVALFVNTAPQFGQKPIGEDLDRIQRSPHYKGDKFVNLIETNMGSFVDMVKVLPDAIFGKGGNPLAPLPVKFQQHNSPASDSLVYVTWYGHSALLIEIENKRILIDPMLTDVSSPVKMGSKRFPYNKPIPIEDLDSIDVVIISHDHYDHLDYKTILKLNSKVSHFYMPLGVGSHLKRWGLEAGKITELDWWQSEVLDGIEFIACPARHFSGRGLTDRDATQWASWVIKGKNKNIYFSGDGGYGPHFKEIGKEYGPFDLAFLECGQYHKAWEAIHMMPEQTVQAGIDVGANVLMPIHWAAFKLAVHSWTEPVERFVAECKKMDKKYIHPYIGERFHIEGEMTESIWWQQ